MSTITHCGIPALFGMFSETNIHQYQARLIRRPIVERLSLSKMRSIEINDTWAQQKPSR